MNDLLVEEKSKKKVGRRKMSGSTVRIDNLADELLRVRDEYAFGLSDEDFAEKIGLSPQGYRRIISDDIDYRPKRTRRTTIQAIADNLNLDFKIDKQNHTIEFFEKEGKPENVTTVNELESIVSEYNSEQLRKLLELGRHLDKESQELLLNLARKLSKQKH